MMFGIKATAGWHGKRQLCVTREVFRDANQGYRFPQVISIKPRADGRFDYVVKDWFRAYDSPAESFADHSKMLRDNARYAACFETKDPREFARRVAAAGYATDPGYAATLVNVIGMLEAIERAASRTPAPAKTATAKPPPKPATAEGGGFFAWLLVLLNRLFGGRNA
jgi:hypothetical protein